MSLLLNKREAVVLAKSILSRKGLDKAYVTRDVDGRLRVGYVNDAEGDYSTEVRSQLYIIT